MYIWKLTDIYTKCECYNTGKILVLLLSYSCHSVNFSTGPFIVFGTIQMAVGKGTVTHRRRHNHFSFQWQYFLTFFKLSQIIPVSCSCFPVYYCQKILGFLLDSVPSTSRQLLGSKIMAVHIFAECIRKYMILLKVFL